MEDNIVGTEEPYKNAISTKDTGHIDERYLYLYAILSYKLSIYSLLFMFRYSSVYSVYLYSKMFLKLTWNELYIYSFASLALLNYFIISKYKFWTRVARRFFSILTYACVRVRDSVRACVHMCMSVCVCVSACVFVCRCGWVCVSVCHIQYLFQFLNAPSFFIMYHRLCGQFLFLCHKWCVLRATIQISIN